MYGAIVALKYEVSASNSFSINLFSLLKLFPVRGPLCSLHVSSSFRVLMALFFFKSSFFNNASLVCNFTVFIKSPLNHFASQISGVFRPHFHFCLLTNSLVSVKEESDIRWSRRCFFENVLQWMLIRH